MNSRDSDVIKKAEFEEIRPEDFRRFHGAKLRANRVELAAPLQIKGDQERREQMELNLEAMVEDRLRRAAAKAYAIEEEARTSAARMLEESAQEASRLIEEGTASRNAIQQQAYNEGFEIGFKEGHQEAVTQVETDTIRLLQGTHAIAQSAYEAEQCILSRFQHNALEIIRTVTEKILHQTLDNTPEALLAMIAQAVEALYLTGKIRVVVSEETLNNLRGFTVGSCATLENLNRFEWVGDPALDLHEIYVLGESASYCLTPSVQTRKLLAPLENRLPLAEHENESTEG